MVQSNGVIGDNILYEDGTGETGSGHMKSEDPKGYWW